MKPTSIIFLVFSLLLIVGGIITCSTAENIAEKDGVKLFNDSVDGGTYVKETVSESITKLELVFTDATVNMFYEDELDKSYVEFINFRDGLYTLTTTGQILSFDEIPNLNSLIHFSSGFSFKGLRGLLRTRTLNLGPKSINVHIAPGNELKILSLSCDNCRIVGSDIRERFDLLINAEKKAELELTHFRTGSALKIETATAVLDFKDTYFDAVTLKADHITSDAEDTFFYHLEAALKDGKFAVSNPSGWSRYTLDLKGNAETMTIEDVIYNLPFDNKDPYAEAPADYLITLDAGDAEILFTYYDMYADMTSDD